MTSSWHHFRSERDGDKEHITMKLSVSHATDVKNEKEERRKCVKSWSSIRILVYKL